MLQYVRTRRADPRGPFEPLAQMARFRNLLVHVYWKIDYGQVYDVIVTRLDDLRAFRAAIVGLL